MFSNTDVSGQKEIMKKGIIKSVMIRLMNIFMLLNVFKFKFGEKYCVILIPCQKFSHIIIYTIKKLVFLIVRRDFFCLKLIRIFV